MVGDLDPHDVHVTRSRCDICGARVKVGTVRTDPEVTNYQTFRGCMRCLAAMLLALAKVGKVDG